MLAAFFTIVTPADLIVITCSVFGILLPWYLQWQFEQLHQKSGVLIITTMFVVSILGAVLVSLVTRQAFSVIFARIFSLVGTSHLILLVSKMELYRRLEMKRMALEQEIIAMEQQVKAGHQHEDPH